MSTAYEIPLSDGQLLEIDRDSGQIRVTIGPYPTDDVLLSDTPPPTVTGRMTYEQAGALMHWLESTIEAYGDVTSGDTV